METNIEINVSYNENEIKKALSFYILRVCEIRTYAFLTYPIIIGAIVLSLIFNEYALLSLVFFFCGVMLFYFYYQRPIQDYLKVYGKRKGAGYRFSDDRVFITGEEIRSECLWSIFKKAYEIPSAFLLVDDNKFVYVFPKTCFNDTLIIEKMRDSLASKFSTFRTYK